MDFSKDKAPLMQIEVTDLFGEYVDLAESEKKNFDPEKAIDSVGEIYKKWVKVTEDLIRELMIAYYALKDGEYEITFKEFCEKAGLPNHNVVKGWIVKHLDPAEYATYQESKKAKQQQSAMEKLINPILDAADISIKEMSDTEITIEIEVLGKTVEKTIAL